jgi:hypothetical protein
MLAMDRRWLHDQDSFFRINCQQTQHLKSRIELFYFSHLFFFNKRTLLEAFTSSLLDSYNLDQAIFSQTSKAQSICFWRIVKSIVNNWTSLPMWGPHDIFASLTRFEMVEFRSSLFSYLICPLYLIYDKLNDFFILINKK